MNTFIELFAGIAIGAILLIMLKTFRDFRHLQSAKILLILLTCTCASILTKITSDQLWLHLPIELVSAGVPALFWIFTLSFFRNPGEADGLNSVHYLLAATSIVLSAAIDLQSSSEQIASYSELYLVDMGLKIILVCLGLAKIAQNWRTDLVECRRRLRALIFGIAGFLVLIAVVSNFLFNGQAQPGFVVLFNITTATFMSLLLGYWMLIVSPNAMIDAAEDNDKSPTLQTDQKVDRTISASDQAWLDKLNQCMQQDAFYRDTELTIKRLSEHLTIPEHQLRRLINQHLGFRNFNDYLNRFRISEASERLADPEQMRLPITTIAIESGYASLTTFNKAFKTLKEMTPSEFRRAANPQG